MAKRLRLKGGFRETREDSASRIRKSRVVIANPKRKYTKKKLK